MCALHKWMDNRWFDTPKKSMKHYVFAEAHCNQIKQYILKF